MKATYTIKRDPAYVGAWTLTFNGKVTHHFRKAEAQARADRLIAALPKAAS